MPLASKFFMPLYIRMFLGLVRNTEDASGSQTALSLTADPRLDILLNRAVLFKDLPEVLG